MGTGAARKASVERVFPFCQLPSLGGAKGPAMPVLQTSRPDAGVTVATLSQSEALIMGSKGEGCFHCTVVSSMNFHIRERGD